MQIDRGTRKDFIEEKIVPRYSASLMRWNKTEQKKIPREVKVNVNGRTMSMLNGR